MSRLIHTIFLFVVMMIICSCLAAYASDDMKRYSGLIVDPHAQVDHEISNDELMKVIKDSGVSKIVLSSIYNRTQESIVRLAKKHPELIVPAVRTKSGAYFSETHDKFKQQLEKQASTPDFAAMQELLGYHAIKKKHAPNEPEEIVASPLDKKIAIALGLAKRKGWPLVLHYEFSSLDNSRRTAFLSELDELLTSNSEHNFVLTHLGQLDHTHVEKLITKHKNIHFTLAETNRRFQENFVCTFIRYGELKPEWQHLLETYPDRFILSIDGVFRGIWLNNYIYFVEEWRLALGRLSKASAGLIAHGNAKRLWPSLR